MYYADFSTYADGDRFVNRSRTVGWLARGQGYEQGTTPEHVLLRLERLAVERRVNQMRGFHYCEFCDREEVKAEFGGASVLLGSAEIWVPGKADLVFAAPDLIVHYIRAHSYKPPLDFIEAVESLNIDDYDAEALWRELGGT